MLLDKKIGDNGRRSVGFIAAYILYATLLSLKEQGALDKILIPLANFSELALNAAQYAIEFAKRSGSKPIFLFFAVSDCTETELLQGDRSLSAQKERKIKKEIEALIDQSTVEGVSVARYECCGEYIEKVCEFVHGLNIAEIVIAIPDKQDQLYHKIKKDISLLVQMTPCRILTVKEKHKGEENRY